MSNLYKNFVYWLDNREDAFHFKVSLAKSALRILAGIALVLGGIVVAGIAFIVAEILGIVEEL
jgi:hypothetical protein